MEPNKHEHVRAVFARAVELRPDHRARFLEETCGDDPEVRGEVQSLLDHHFAESIVKAPRGGAALFHAESNSASTQSPLRLFARPGYRRTAIATAGLFILLLGWWTHARVQSALLRMRAGELQEVLASKAAALETWVREEKVQVRMLAREDELRGPALRLLRIGEEGKAAVPALKSSPERQALIHYLRPHLEDLGFSSIEIYDPRGLQVFATFDPYEGDQLNENGLAMLAPVLAGETVFEKPYRPGPLFADIVPGTMYTVIGAPIRGDDGRVEGALSAIQPAYRAFADIVAGRIGETGETYAFDQRAVMLTPSPFAEDLRQVGLISEPDNPSREWDVNSQLNLRLRDPGRLLSSEEPASNEGTSLPLTRLASTALARGPEDDLMSILLEPYRNYRGTTVIGAWRWVPKYDLVLAAEMETTEAFAPLRYLDTTFGMLIGLLSLSVGVGLLASFKAARLRGRLHELKQLGQYRLLELIGEGGMGRVYLAEHAALKRRTAVKILSPELHSDEAIARFEREVMVSSQLTHPNTIEIYDYGRSPDGVFYYAMEYIDGLSLAELVSRFGPVPAGRAVHLLEQICRSLKEAHGRGVVHRDIKPLNIMICCRGGLYDVIKVLDFGLAKLGENGSAEALTKPARIGGTLMYMAPERFLSPESVDARADIYSLGGVAYYLLTAKPPFQPVHDLDLIHQIGNVRPKRPSEVVDVSLPSALEHLVMECLEKAPERRPPSADEVERRLQTIGATIRWSEDEASRWWSERDASP